MPGSEPTVWVVSELYYPEETSTGNVMTTIAEGLADEFTTRVVCAQPTYSNRGTRAPDCETHNGVDISRVRSTTFSTGSILGRLANMVTITTSTALLLSRNMRSGDTVFVVTNPPIAPYVVSVIARLKGVTTVLVVHDIFPEILEAVSGRRAIYAPLHWLSRRLYSTIEHVAVIGPDQRELIESKVPQQSRPHVHVIPLAHDDGFDGHIDRSASRFFEETLGHLEEESVVFQFAGNIGPLQGVDFLSEAISEVRDEHAHFCFVGAGRSAELVAPGASDQPNVSFVPWRPREEAPDLHAGCDVVIVSLREGMLGVSVPSRIGNALAAGRPILAVCESGSTLDRLIEEHAVGLTVRPGDRDGFWNAVEWFVNNHAGRSDMGRRARTLAESSYKASLMAERYRDVARSAIRSTGHG